MTSNNTTTNFHSTFALSSKQYKGYYLKRGALSTYVDDVEVYNHKGYGVFSGSVFKGFRFTQVAAKALVNHLETV